MADSGEFDGMCSLKSQLVPNIPGSIYYIPEFISEEEEEYLIRQVNDSPKPKWTQLLNRRLQNWGGLPHKKGMVTEPIPEWLNRYCSKITDLGVFEGKKANHVLVNEYKPGQGIMPHLDGDLYYPTVSTITLGSHTLLDFYRPLEETGGNNQEDLSDTGSDQAPAASSDFSQRHLTSVLLERRSLVLVKDDMFHTYLHGITEVTSDTLTAKVANLPMCTARPADTMQRGTRISLTIRHVPKVLKIKLGFGRR